MNKIHNGLAALVVAALAALAGCAKDKACPDFCGAGSTCVSGSCVAITCSAPCAAGQFCETGSCVDVDTVTCAGSPGACQVCDTSGTSPAWVNVCGPAATCDTASNTCKLVSQQIHSEISALDAPFANGWEVTAKCVGCHPQQAADPMQTAHWRWAGSTPSLMDGAFVDDLDPAAAATLDPLASYGVEKLGKVNLVNNFCVATVSNDKRCDQCHAGYGGDPNAAHVQKSARNYTGVDATSANTALSSIPLEDRVDCLICHADLTASGYVKATANFGAADAKPASGCATMPSQPPGVEGCAAGYLCLADPQNVPSCYPTTGAHYKGKVKDALAAATQTVRRPDRENCGYCHFYAGGGDSVKLMGSSLRQPSRSLDVHMGGGMTCADCHAQPGHEFSGAGIHVPAHTQPVSCADCHSAAPHANASWNTHARKIACQTCHIPRFSRGQFSKVNWDWSTTGQKGSGVVKSHLVDGAVASDVETYSYIKGDFVWSANIAPAYAWYDGRMTHATILDKANFDVEGLSSTEDATRITLGAPVGRKCSPGAKIHPFKLMRGKQAIYRDPASTDGTPRDFVINPNVFGMDSLWGVLQSPAWTQARFDAGEMVGLWSSILTKGAKAAGQYPAGAATMIPATAGVAGWEFRCTKLYMDLNHEVAPKQQALGCGNACTTCHDTATPAIPLQQLGYTLPLGYTSSCP